MQHFKNSFILIYTVLSFSALAVDPIRYRDMIDDLYVSQECKNELKAVYASGDDLSSSALKKELVLLKDIANPQPGSKADDHPGVRPERKLPMSGYDFYHYTNFNLGQFLQPKVKKRDKAQPLIREAGGYEEIFTHVKKRYLANGLGSFFNAGLFIAEDSSTSSNFGDMRLTLELSPETRVFKTYNSDGRPVEPLNWDIVKENIAQKLTRVLSCRFEELQPLIAEDSGADIIAYGGGPIGTWYIILNSRAIERSKFE